MGMRAGVAVRTLLSVLGCLMVAVLVYTIATDGLPFRIDLLTSVTTCAYIVFQFYKLTPEEESSKDPFYFLLVRHQKSDVIEHRKGVSVMTARLIFALLACFMLGTLLYTLIVDGSPFRSQLYTPWVVATLIDFYINVVALSVWVAYKESSWMHAFLWILFLICFGSITTCLYIVRQLFYLSSDQPIFLILFHNNHR
ncbi:hypothetical protein M8C21_010927, partial [Ambrosia artemisiifolia]